MQIITKFQESLYFTLQACQTVVDFKQGHVTKSCINPKVCETKCTDSKSKCSFCCHGHLCNQPMDGFVEGK